MEDKKGPYVTWPIMTNGPWYVYGPILALIGPELTKRIGKVMPDHAFQGE